MTKTVDMPASHDIVAASRAIRKRWNQRERHRRREMAARKQQALLDLLAPSASPTAAHVA